MDSRHFDTLTRALSSGNSRRRLLGALAALPTAGGLRGFLDPDHAEGQGRRRRRKRRHKHGRGRRRTNRRGHHRKPPPPPPPPQPQFNSWGCVDAGNFCQDNDQCCSGVCTGTGHTRACISQDNWGCPPGQSIELCGGTAVQCPDTGNGQCATSTGNAAICALARWSLNPPCTRDVECQAVTPSSACMVCEGRTFCALTPEK